MGLRDDALRIWKAGVAAVDSARLVREHIACDQNVLTVCGRQFALNELRHLEVVGCGKAGAGMASGLEQALAAVPEHLSISGWLNVPADCVRPLQRIHLCAARPAGVNEPTAEGVVGTAEILRRVSALQPQDLCLVLLSGGGSALLCQPVPEISLAEKLAVTRALASDGAPIRELNCVRTQLSLVKGGRLAAACRAGTLMALIISDVVGDPLEVIASGPTVDCQSTADDALQILSQRGLLDGRIPPRVIDYLKSRTNVGEAVSRQGNAECRVPSCHVINRVIGNNQTAMDAAAAEAERLGYQVMSLGSANQSAAADEGRDLYRRLRELRRPGTGQRSGPRGVPGVCLLSGGEPVVQLKPARVPRRGGRNQELVLAAVSAFPHVRDWQGIVLLSGGTDGEDGPTDAAGAVADEDLLRRLEELPLRPDDYLAINNSYPFFEQLGGLIRTGPTHTNVMDLRVGLTD